MGRMSELDIALHEEPNEKAEILDQISAAFKRLAEIERGEAKPEPAEDRLTNTYETDESLEAKDRYAKEHPHAAEPEPEEGPTLVEVRAVLAEISRSGKTAAVKAIIAAHGCSKLSEVPEAEYAQVLKEAEALRDAR